MKKLINISLLLVLVTLSNIASAQYDPIRSQYMFTPMVLNPAYAGLHDMASANLSWRGQWLGLFNDSDNRGDFRFGGAPIATTLNFHTSLPVEKMGAGLTVVRQSYGVNTDMDMNLAWSYRLEMGENKMQFGLLGNLRHVAIDYTKLNQKNPGEDPVFNQNGGRTTDSKPNFGAGMMYTTPTYFFGLSVPRLLKYDIDDGTGAENTLTYGQIFYGTAGYVFDLANEMKFKPSTLVRVSPGSAVNFDLNGEVLFNEVLWLGLSFRSNAVRWVPNATVVMAQFQINDFLKAGYSADFSLVGNLGRAGGWVGTHEILVNMNFALFDEHAVQTIYF